MAEEKTPAGTPSAAAAQHGNVLPSEPNFPAEEENVLKLWKDIDAFHSSFSLNAKKPQFTFYDGPPFATGLPHYGHILAGESVQDRRARPYFLEPSPSILLPV